MLDRVKHRSNGTELVEEFLVDSKEAGSATGLLHVLKSGNADPAFATVKARGDATVRKRVLYMAPCVVQNLAADHILYFSCR